MKKVYITALHLLQGGAEQAIVNLANGLSKRGYQVTIWCIYRLGEPAYPLLPEVRVEYLTDCAPNREKFKSALKGFRLLKVVKEGFGALKTLYLKRSSIIKCIKDTGEGIIISSRMEHNRYLARYGRQGVLKIGQYHYGDGFSKRLIRDMKGCYRGLDYFIVLNDILKAEAEKIMKSSHCRAEAIGNFLPEELSERLQKEAQGKRERIIFSAGRLSYEKGYDRLIECFIKMKTKDCRLLIAGDGPEREKIEKMAGECENVHFLGMLGHREVLEYMNSSMLYALPSRSEGFGYVIIEAQNAGLPVVSFDVPTGPQVLIRNGENGILVKDGDTDAFAGAMDRLLADEKLRQELAKAAQESVLEFSEEKIMDKWERLF